MATMFPSDDAIVAAIREELRTADMNNTTVKTIRAAVSAKLGVDLTEKKDFVKQTVDRLLAEQVAQDTAADADADADEDAADEDAPEADGPTAAAAPEDDNLWGNVVPRRRAAPLPKAPKPLKAKKAARPADGAKRKSGFQALCTLSPAMASFMGVSEMTRSDATKRIWEYVKSNDLPRDSKGKVLLDEKLQSLFQRKTLSFATVSAALKRHVTQTYADE